MYVCVIQSHVCIYIYIYTIYTMYIYSMYIYVYTLYI